MGRLGRFLHGTSLIRPGIGSGPAVVDQGWFSWVRWFQYAFTGFTLLAIIGALTDGTISSRERTASVLIALFLAGWMWFRGRWERVKTTGDALLYFIVLLPLLTIAIRLYDGFGLLIFGAYWQGFAYFRIRAAMLYALILTVLIQIGFSDATSLSPSELSISLPQVLGGVIGLLVAGMMAAYMEGLGREADRRQGLLNELRAAQDALAARERESGIMTERQRLAGEIHDTVAQHLTSIVTNLEAAESRAETNPDAAWDHIHAAREAARQGIADARAMVAALQPQVLEGRSISDALRQVSEDYATAAEYRVLFEEAGPSGRIDRLQETILIRALQESLQNIRKHAGASTATVSLNWLDDEVILDIQDDGAGFDPASVPKPLNGHQVGLRTMRQRVEGAGGTWMVESSPGEGTSLAVSFPLGGIDEGR